MLKSWDQNGLEAKILILVSRIWSQLTILQTSMEIYAGITDALKFNQYSN